MIHATGADDAVRGFQDSVQPLEARAVGGVVDTAIRISANSQAEPVHGDSRLSAAAISR